MTLLSDIGVIVLMFFAALAWGGNESWAMGIVSFCGIGLLAFRLLWDVWTGELELQPGWFYLPLGLFLLLGILQPSVEKHTTTQYLLLAASYVSIVFLVHTGFQSRGRVRLLLLSILALAAFEALYGLVQYLGNYDYIWDFSKTAGQGLATGTFINRNHFALLLNLGISTGTGYLFYRSIGLLRDDRRTLRALLAAPGAAKLTWMLLVLAVMGLALVFSMSRMGIFAMLLSIPAMIVVGNASETRKRATAIGLALLLAILGLAFYTGADAVLARFENVAQERLSDKDRVALWRDAWPMIQKHLITGQGLGTFRWTYPAYEKVDADTPALYAHSDYVQALAEVGIVGLILLLWAFAAAYGTAIRNLFRSTDPLVRGIGLGALGGLTAIALQEITDFGLYIPGVAVMAAVLVGLNLRAGVIRD